MRGIAADAGVHAALPHHFLGTKQALFAASMNLPFAPGGMVPPVLEGPTTGSASVSSARSPVSGRPRRAARSTT